MPLPSGELKADGLFVRNELEIRKGKSYRSEFNAPRPLFCIRSRRAKFERMSPACPECIVIRLVGVVVVVKFSYCTQATGILHQRGYVYEPEQRDPERHQV